MRYVIFGAGAIGGTIGGRLHLAGHEVVLIARGEHLAALQSEGLRLASPEGEETLRVPAVASPADAGIDPDSAVILAMKTQDTADALDEMVTVAPPRTPIVCAQNGVENERIALRRFANVLGVMVFLMAEHLEPGRVVHFAAPTPGVLDLGPVPPGPPGSEAISIAADLRGAGFGSLAVRDVMRRKRRKLLLNLGNAIEVIYGPDQEPEGLDARARAEERPAFERRGSRGRQRRRRPRAGSSYPPPDPSPAASIAADRAGRASSAARAASSPATSTVRSCSSDANTVCPHPSTRLSSGKPS